MSTEHGFSNVTADDGFFNFSIFGRDFVGIADVAITTRSSVYINPAGGLRFVMKLEKHLNPDKGLNCAQGYQAMVSLLLASMKYLEYHPLGLVTDLGQTWRLYCGGLWFTDTCLEIC
jgi:hypothetical protein